jgi:hypothetical protein
MNVEPEEEEEDGLYLLARYRNDTWGDAHLLALPGDRRQKRAGSAIPGRRLTAIPAGPATPANNWGSARGYQELFAPPTARHSWLPGSAGTNQAGCLFIAALGANIRFCRCERGQNRRGR